jgi:hypothetical protein
MVGQDAQVEHIRVGQHYTGLPPDGRPLRLRGIAVKGVYIIAFQHRAEYLPQPPQLVLGQRLGGE